MACRSDYYKEDQPTGWPSLSRRAMMTGVVILTEKAQGILTNDELQREL